MTGEMATQYAWLWPLAWQSTVCLAAGLGASVILRRRATRAHQILLCAIIAAIAIPALARVVRHNHWGLFVAERTVPRRTSESLRLQTDLVAAGTIAQGGAVSEAGPVAQSAEAVSSPSGEMTRRQLVLPLWFVISSILLLRLAARFILALRLARRSESSCCAAIEHALPSAREKLGIEDQVVAQRSEGIRSPVIWCWNRRAILLIPAPAAQDESLDWSSIVCHELAHWKRRDHISGLLAELMVCLLPWQPLLWWGRKRLTDLSEQACDDWVVASGQAGTRYARTLLSLTPQGYAALAPAVVAGRSGLGARVRRIVGGQCADPHSSLHWTLAVAAVTACLSLGIALAQTRPALSDSRGRAVLGHGAMIEQAVSARSLTGRVLDPNGQPLAYQPVRVTALPLTGYAVEPNGEGYFQLPWSPDWTSGSQRPRLLVRDREKNLALLAEIQDLPGPMILRPEPGLTITGQVADPNGQPLLKAIVLLSLIDRFPCQAPLAAARTNDKGEFKIAAVPCRHTYRLTIRADGHVTNSMDVSATDTSARVFDAGVRILASRRPGEPDEDPYQNPDGKKDFHQIYRLDEGEILKLIKPPFPPARQDYVFDCFFSYGVATAAANISSVVEDACYVCAGFRWDGQLENGPMFCGGGLPRLQTVLNAIFGIPDYDFRLSEEMRCTHLPKGDWIVQKGASPEEQLKALEQIIAAELHRPLHFEQRTAERDTIVVTGRYAFTPWPGKDPNRLLIFARDAEAASWSDEAPSLAGLFDKLADGIDMAIDNRSAAPAGTIRYAYDGSLMSWRGEGIDKEKDLPALLNHLARQTGLQFQVERRPVPMWFVIEDTAP